MLSNVVLCCCLFFFKQKTAYERRISDWSSDVCSSDLLDRERAADAIEMACIGLGVSRDDLARQPALTATINTNSPLQLDIPMCEGQIGRASCRERVCQYV